MRPPPRRDLSAQDRVAPSEVIFEIIVRGAAARCAAVDVATGLEVVVVGPPSGAHEHLKMIALRKLRMRLAKG